MAAPRNPFEQSGYDQLKKTKVKFEYEPKDKRVSYTIDARWLPDFVLNGRIYIEFKGYLRPSDRRKLSCVRRCHPDLDLRIVFQRRNEAYLRWAERNGWQAAVGTIPKSWIKEAKC